MSDDTPPWQKVPNSISEPVDWSALLAAELAVEVEHTRRVEEEAEELNDPWEATMHTIRAHGLLEVTRVYVRWRWECWRYGDDE